jgi:hypothetical protein
MATILYAKGMTNMKSVHPIFKTKEVRHFINELIENYHYQDYSQLSESDKAQLASLLIEASGKDGEHECIVESNNFDQTMHYLKKALCGNQKDNQDFLRIIKSNAIHYYENTMESLFMEAI